MFKKICVVVLSLLNVFLLYQAVGSLIIAIKNPVLYDGEYVHFMGMYIMSITYFALVLLCSTIIVLLTRKKRNKKQ